MLDVAELVSHDPIQLIVAHDVEESGGDGQRGVLCIASGGEGVRRRIVHYEDFGLGKAGPARQPLDCAVQLRKRHRIGRFGSGHSEHRSSPTEVSVGGSRQGDDAKGSCA